MPGLTADDPVFLQMKEIIHSREGIAAALEATAAGKPALAGVDPLLKAALGSQYRKYDQGPQSAGYEVAKVMRKQGYKPHKAKQCGDGCVAGTALTWLPVS